MAPGRSTLGWRPTEPGSDRRVKAVHFNWSWGMLPNDLCFSGGRRMDRSGRAVPPINIGARPRLVKRSAGRPSDCKHWLAGGAQAIQTSTGQKLRDLVKRLVTTSVAERRQPMQPVDIAPRGVQPARLFALACDQRGEIALR